MNKKLFIQLTSGLTLLMLLFQCQQEETEFSQAGNNSFLQDTLLIQELLDEGAKWSPVNPDSSLYYFQEALARSDTALKNFMDRPGKDRQDEPLLSLKAESLQKMGKIFRSTADYEQALVSFTEALQHYENTIDTVGIITCYNEIGLINRDKGNYSMALDYHIQSLQLAEQIQFTKGMSWGYNNIGGIHWYQGNYDAAIDYFRKSLAIYEELGDKRGMSISYCNIGLVYLNQEQFTSAEAYTKKSLDIDTELDDIAGMSYGYSNMGVINENQGRYEAAIDYYQKALQTCRKLGDKEGIALTCSNMASIFIKQAEKLREVDRQAQRAKLDKALKYAVESYQTALDMGTLQLQNTASVRLQEIFTQLGRYREALRYAEINIETYDSIFSEEKASAIAEMTTKYEAEKKQLHIEQMQKQKELDDRIIETQRKENRKQRIILFLVVAGFVVVLVFSILVLNLLRQKRRANAMLQEQNAEINRQNEKIEAQHRNITDSIIYAQRIQRALLPPGDYMKELLPQRFVFYQPRDIVSGDFYWVSKKDDVVVVVSADCTGHGVPGAMMSMLGVSILNEIVNTIQDLDAATILDTFRTKLIDSLHQGEKETAMFDGIDLALALISPDKGRLQFSGANCPLYLIRDHTLIIHKGDKMPIGIHARMDPFTNHDLNIKPDDMIYLFSDGYMDQFGGTFDKRFTRKKFQDLLLQIHKQPLEQQKSLLFQTLDDWKRNSDQVDDVLVIGVKI